MENVIDFREGRQSLQYEAYKSSHTQNKEFTTKFPKIAYVLNIFRAAVNLKLPNARPVPGRGHFHFATSLMPSEFLL